MAKDQKIVIRLSRKITFNREGQEPLELQAGKNIVDADVAEHPFVKAFRIDGDDEAIDNGDAALQAKIAELQAALDAANARAEAAEAKAGELQAVVDAYAATNATKTGAKK